jgi:hypothetical protein
LVIGADRRIRSMMKHGRASLLTPNKKDSHSTFNRLYNEILQWSFRYRNCRENQIQNSPVGGFRKNLTYPLTVKYEWSYVISFLNSKLQTKIKIAIDFIGVEEYNPT